MLKDLQELYLAYPLRIKIHKVGQAVFLIY